MNYCRRNLIPHMFLICLCVVFTVAVSFGAVKSIVTPEGIYGHPDLTKLPWCSYTKHDPNRPVPAFIDTGTREVSVEPPSDAVVLFDGKTLSAWHRSDWKLSDGIMTAGGGFLTSRKSFGDCQLHLEFMVPQKPGAVLSNRGNSGVLLMGLYEVQIFDSHPSNKQQIYPDGQCGSVYGETPPLLNACRLPGQWQSFDIIFTAPVFEKGKLAKAAAVTMLHNGVLVHLNTTIHGPMAWRKISQYRPHGDKLPLKIQGHGSPVSFRNIWIRPLNNNAKMKSK